MKSLLNGVPLKESFFKSHKKISNNELVRLYVEDKFMALGIYHKRKDFSFIKVKKLFS